MKPESAVRLDRTVGRQVYKLHRLLYRLSRGRVGAKFEGRPILLLTTTGRRTGEPRTQPLLSYPHGDAMVVVASNGGRPEMPAWLLNVEANPEVQVQVRNETYPAKARIAGEGEHAALWPELTKYYPGWAHYTTLTDRPLPVVILERA